MHGAIYPRNGYVTLAEAQAGLDRLERDAKKLQMKLVNKGIMACRTDGTETDYIGETILNIAGYYGWISYEEAAFG